MIASLPDPPSLVQLQAHFVDRSQIRSQFTYDEYQLARDRLHNAEPRGIRTLARCRRGVQ